MVKEKASVFRSQALERYMNRHEKSTFSKLLAPKTFLYLWLILGLLFIGGLCVLLADIPMYAPAIAVVVEGDGTLEPDSREVKVVLLLSPEYLTQLKVNQSVFFRMGRVHSLVNRRISVVEPRISNAAAIRNRFALTGDSASKVNHSTVVAFIPLEPLPNGMEASSYLGTSYEAQVEIGHRRLGSFLPVVGRFFASRSTQVNALLPAPSSTAAL